MFSKVWWLSTLERLGKTFLQGYIALWLLTAGLTNPTFDQPNTGAFDTLFTMNNLKAGIVAAALSFASSVASTPFGADNSAPSLTVTETPPTTPSTP